MEGSDPFAKDWERMLRKQLAGRGITCPRLLSAMGQVPRHQFVAEGQQHLAYQDQALAIDCGQTISQPYIVASMSEALKLSADHLVLEIGTGSGYQAAVLAELAAAVYSIEIVTQLEERARDTLAELGYANVQVKQGDGYAGWPEQAPFDAIMVTAAPDHIPQPLVDQLAVGGRLIIPVGQNRQTLTLLTRTEDGVEQRQMLPVLFVPMTGQAERR